jgi:hypothetical protein
MIALVPVVAALLAASGSGVPWTRDYGKAFASAEEQRRPVLLFFRGECGGGHRPQNPMSDGPLEHQEGLSECDLMQQDVWEDAGVVSSIERYIPVIVDGGDRTLQVRYQAVRMPTTLVTDPWGNEIVRGSGYIARDKMQRLLAAMPTDFAALAEAAQALRKNPADFTALTEAAAFYEAARLPQVVERLYGLALNTPRSAAPAEAWRKAVIARGLNLLLGLNSPGAAALLFESEVAASPEAAGTVALLLGVVNARLQEGKRKEAETAVKKLEQKYPTSPYAQRARQNLEATAKH